MSPRKKAEPPPAAPTAAEAVAEESTEPAAAAAAEPASPDPTAAAPANGTEPPANGTEPPANGNGDDAGEEAVPSDVNQGGGGRRGLPLAMDADATPLHRMMDQYFMEYASYVIKDRAIPDLDDGLKPVQRRILHSLYEKHDGHFHKVANIVGHTMQYHPHGDASIYSALVTVANKEYFIEKQGNFGNIFTGDPPAAARYIECRLSPLALEVLFNPEITEFAPSYDGRNREPVVLPAKVPVLLMQGTEGIAVGMATRILSHNFKELLEAQIAILREQPYRVYPDFFQGGIMDVSEYHLGNGKVRLRALIEKTDHKTLTVREIPATVTTELLIASIEDMAQKGKVKIASINDYTAEAVEIEIRLPRGVDADHTIKALYAYTRCEESVSCNCLLIRGNRPVILDVNQVLEHCTRKLMTDLGRELELQLGKLEDQFHSRTLAQIFIEERIYQRLEKCETIEAIMATVRAGLEEFKHLLRRPITDEDIERLLQIQIRRISLFDINKNQEEIAKVLKDIDVVKDHLAHLKRYTIDYLKALIKKYGHHFPRRTRIENIEEVDVREIALSNVKVGHDRAAGYVGTSIRGDEPIVCTEFDKLVVLGWDGVYKVLPIPDKLYVGSVCAVFKSEKERIYSMIYRDRKTRVCYAKRFRVDRFIMEREYASVPKGCKVERIFDRYGVVVDCEFEPLKGQRQTHVEVDFEQVPLRNAGAKGFRIHDRPIAKFIQIKRGSDLPTGEAEPAPAEVPEAPDEPEAGPRQFDTLKLRIPQPETDAPATIPIVRLGEDAADAEPQRGRKAAGERRRARAATTKSSAAPAETSPGAPEPPPAPKPLPKVPVPPAAPPADPPKAKPAAPPSKARDRRFRIDENAPFELE